MRFVGYVEMRLVLLFNFADDYMDRLWRDEAKSRGIKIRIPPNGIRQKVSIRRGQTGRARERKREHGDRTMRKA